MSAEELVKSGFVKDLQQKALAVIRADRDKFSLVWDVINKYCMQNNIIISDKYALTKEQDTLPAICEKSFKLYTPKPFQHANKITNLLHKETKNKYIRLKTVYEHEELAIEFDLRIVCSLHKLQESAYTIVHPEKINGLSYMSPELELIDIYKDLYTMNSVSSAIKFEQKLFDYVKVRKEKGILGGDCKDRRRDLIESIKIALVKNWLAQQDSYSGDEADDEDTDGNKGKDTDGNKGNKKDEKIGSSDEEDYEHPTEIATEYDTFDNEFSPLIEYSGGKKSNKNSLSNSIFNATTHEAPYADDISDVSSEGGFDFVGSGLLDEKGNPKFILIGSWARDWIKSGDAICANAEKVQLVGDASPAYLQNILQSYISQPQECPVTYREQELHIPKDFRTNRYTYYLSFQNDKGQVEKPFLDFFNSASFELVPYRIVNNIAIAHKYFILRFLFIDLWIIRIVKKLGLINAEVLNKKINHLWDNIEYFRAEDSISKLEFLGIYRDYMIDKKMNTLGVKTPYPYYPEIYFDSNKKYREI